MNQSRGSADSPDEARLIEKARQIVDQTSEVRAEKVAALREAIRKGTYQVDARKLANILILQMLTEREPS